MRWLIALLAFPLAAIGQPLNFAWDNAPINPAGTTTELLINGQTFSGYTGTTATIEVPVIPGQNIDAKARAIPPTGWQCVLNPAQDLSLCTNGQTSTPECPLKLCEPSVYSNQVLVTNPADPSNIYATKTWTGLDPVDIAPVFIGEYETAWNSATSPKNTPSIAVQPGDILVAYAAHENATGTRNLNISSGALTWTLQKSLTTNGYAEADLWTATATANQTFTVSFTGANGYFGGNVLLFRNSSGIGSSVSATNSTPAISITTTKAKSAIVFVTADWNAADGTSKIWKNNAIETSYFRDSARYTVYGSYVSNIGAIGAYQIGLNSTSLQKYSNIAIEVKGK
jgi:hypothetical protein